jgi:hypothetical protein
MVSMSSQTSDVSSEKNGLISNASTAAAECRQGATAQSSIVQRPAKPAFTESTQTLTNGQKSISRPVSSVTVSFPIGKRNSYPATCEACGDAFIAKRPWGRFCSGACRVAAFRARQAAKKEITY